MTLVCEDLHVRLGRRQALTGVSATMRPGELWAVVGPNGAGKSTLLRAAAGLRRPDHGRVTWAGTDVAAMVPQARARRIGWVPQAMVVRDPFTVREVVAMGRYAHDPRLGPEDRADRRAVADAMSRAHVLELADRPVTNLSGGERQRVLLARTLAQDPTCLLLDEPTANLDLGQAAHVWSMLRGLAREGRAVLAVVHDLELASRVADGILMLADGRVVAAGTPREVLAPERIEAAFRTPVSVSWVDEDGARIRVRGGDDA